MNLTHGLFGWVDNTSPNVEASRAFYEGLFGWTSTDTPMPGGPAYTQFYKDGQLVAGLGPMPDEMLAAGVPSTWNSYVIVTDADEIAKATEAAGGQVVMPVMDIMTEGRMALISDPSGATLGIWQPLDHQGAELFNEPGSLTWNELQSRDLERAKAFYSDVFGWRWVDGEVPDAEYYVGNLDTKTGDDKSNCGAMPMPDMVPATVPSMWMVYFAVADCDASVARAQELGATLFFPPMDMGPGRFAGVTDPVGAMFFFGAMPPS
jgi:predicted enzyme related to lactoylglutathione lyase